jgi:hypothetical protein
MGEASTLALLRTCVRTLAPIIPAGPANGLVNIDHISTNLCTIDHRKAKRKSSRAMSQIRKLQDSGL